MLISEIITEKSKSGRGPKQGWKAYCTNTPDHKMPNSWLSSCKARGYVARDTKKSQKIGNKRKKLDGRRLKSTKYGGPVSPTKTG